jgi:hypothetical protein
MELTQATRRFRGRAGAIEFVNGGPVAFLRQFVFQPRPRAASLSWLTSKSSNGSISSSSERFSAFFLVKVRFTDYTRTFSFSKSNGQQPISF